MPSARKSTKGNFDKYELYRASVQSPDTDAEFLGRVYKELRGKSAKVLREDFCGTGLLAMEWAKRGRDKIGYGVDLDPEPMTYGIVHDLDKMPANQKERIHLVKKNVLSPGLPKADVSAALNFSYFLFKERATLKKYFMNVKNSLKPNGVAVFDCFGGSQCYDKIEDTTRHKGFTYYWDQTGFDPVTNEALFYIHFRHKGRKHKKVFTYDWRMWSIPEIRDLLDESGFKKTHIYWEGTTRNGEGDGKFVRTEKGEACLSWVAYVVALK